MSKAVFVGVLALALGACAEIPRGPSHSKTAVPGADDDVVKVASVNRWAADKGATVVWIHIPTKVREDTPLGR